MPNMSGNFNGRVEYRGASTVADQDDHQMMLAEVQGPQRSSDPGWDGSTITYTAVLDLVGGTGRQQGYFVNTRVDGDRDWGTFEGAITLAGTELRCDGTWQFTGGSGRYQGITGRGTFSMRMPSPERVETTWEGSYELAVVSAG